MKDDIIKILTTAVNAPSGHNSQPWRFVMRGATLMVYNKPQADDTIYNYKERGSYIAHGALIENIVLEARVCGYTTSVSITPHAGEPDLMVSIVFEKGEPEQSEIASAISKRATNRKAFDTRPLEAGDAHALFDLPSGDSLSVLIVEDIQKKKRIADVFSLHERLLFENSALHQSLFPYIRWSRDEERLSNSGMYIKTLELPRPIEALFRLFTFKPVARALGALGFGRAVAAQNSTLYAQSSAFFVIIADEVSTQNLIATGRALEHIWLTATARDVALQVMGGMLYLGQRVQDPDDHLFSPSQVDMIKSACQNLNKYFDVPPGKKILIAARIGYSTPSKSISIKRAPLITFE